MIIEKIQHYLSLLFVIVLILVQGLIFVMTKADFSPGLLIDFVEPSNTSIYKGEIVDLQAYLTGLSTSALEELGLGDSITCSDLDIIDYNFVLKDSNSEDIIFFSGDSFYNQETCLLESSVTWDTSQYDVGNYYLAVQVDIEGISRSNISSPQHIIGCNDIEALNYDSTATGCSSHDVNDFSCCEYETEGAGNVDNIISFESELFQISIVVPEYQGNIDINLEDGILLINLELEDIGISPENVELIAANTNSSYDILLNRSNENELIYFSEEINTSEWLSGAYSLSMAPNLNYNLNLSGDIIFDIELEEAEESNNSGETNSNSQPIQINTVNIELDIVSEDDILEVSTNYIEGIESLELDIASDSNNDFLETLVLEDNGTVLSNSISILNWIPGEYSINLSSNQEVPNNTEFNIIGDNIFTIELEDNDNSEDITLDISNITFTVIEPNNISGETFSNNIYIDIESDQEINNDIDLSVSLFLLDNNEEEDLQDVVVLERASTGNRFYTDLDISNYINGEYRLNISVSRNSEAISINDYIFYINNNQRIILNSPEENGTISTLNFIVDITTNFSSESLFLEFINEDSAITTGEIEINSDGQGNNWVRTVSLNPYIFYTENAQGNYSLIVSGIDEDGESIERVFNLILGIVGIPSDGEDDVIPIDNDITPPEENEEDDDTDDIIPDDLDYDTLEEDDNVIPEEGDTTPPEEGLSYEENNNIDQICIDQGILNEETCLEYLVMINENIPEECTEQEIYNNEACEDYLNLIYTNNECEEHSPPIIDPEECSNYLLETYSSNVNCNLEDQSACNEAIEGNLNYLVIEQNNQELVTEVIDSLVGQVVELSNLKEELENNGVENILPIEDGNIYLANSQEEIILEDEDTLTIRNKVVIILDDDGDGLSNDLEEYYGTDKNNRDTDNDGYFDSQEILNNYNPLGEGALDIERLDFDKIVLNDLPLEQPIKKSAKIVEYLNVDNIESNNEDLVLSGIAEANTWVNIYLYSKLPLVMIAKTDESGNWSYTVKKSLVDGEHKAYVTVNDDTGKIVKQSNSLSFLIKSAKAVSAADYFDSTTTQDKIDYMVLNYVLGTIFLILLSLGVILYLHKEKAA